MDGLAALEKLLRGGGRAEDAASVARRGLRVADDQDEAVALWLWLADLPPPEGAVSQWDQAVAAYVEAVCRVHGE